MTSVILKCKKRQCRSYNNAPARKHRIPSDMFVQESPSVVASDGKGRNELLRVTNNWPLLKALIERASLSFEP